MKKYIIIGIFAIFTILIISIIVVITHKHNTEVPDEEPMYEEITMVLPTYGYVPEYMDVITENLNRISMEKCHIKVNYIYTGSTELNQSMQLRLSAGEKIDLMPCLEEEGLLTLMSENLISPLNELMSSNAPDLLELFYPRIWDALGDNGEIYALPAAGSQSDWGGILLNTEVVEAGGISLDELAEHLLQADGTNVEKIASVFTPVFESLKHSDAILSDSSPVSEKQLAPGLNGYGGIFSQLPLIDGSGYGNSFGIVIDGTDEVVNLFELPQYRDELELLKKWNDSGYIYHLDRTTDEDPAMVYGGRNRIGLFTSLGVTVENSGEILPMGTDTYIPFVKNPLTTDKFRIGTWVIPVNSEHKDAAIKILNLMYTDEEYVRAYNYSAGENPEEEVPFRWLFGNTLLTNESLEQSLKHKEDYETMEFADYFGFTYEPGENAHIVDDLQNILSKYMPDLENGIIDDVDISLKKLNDELYAAGLDIIMEDKQAQLDEWIRKMDSDNGF